MWINTNTEEVYRLHSEFRSAFPQTSFPRNLINEIMAGFGVEPVNASEKPLHDHTKNVTEGTPVLVDGVWEQTWLLSDATTEEIVERTEAQAQSVRSERNSLLSESDWTQVADAPVDATAWATYRQALRDITVHPNFPYLLDDDWPVKPD